MKVTVPQNLDIVDLHLRISFILVDLYLKMVKSAQSQIHIQQQNNLDLLGTNLVLLGTFVETWAKQPVTTQEPSRTKGNRVEQVVTAWFLFFTDI